MTTVLVVKIFSYIILAEYSSVCAGLSMAESKNSEISPTIDSEPSQAADILESPSPDLQIHYVKGDATLAKFGEGRKIIAHVW